MFSAFLKSGLRDEVVRGNILFPYAHSCPAPVEIEMVCVCVGAELPMSETLPSKITSSGCVQV